MGAEPATTKEKVFVAAIKVFARKGFKGATVREICKGAASGNMNVVNYYFGGKAKLYKAILEIMFAELGNRMRALGSTDSAVDPEKRLRELIQTYCSMLFSTGDIGADMLAIYNNEMAQPSPFLNGLVNRYLVPQNKNILMLFCDLLGDNAPHWLLRDTAVSVFSQIMYYSGISVMFKQIHPTHPGMEAYHAHLAEHVFRFSMAGIKEMKRAFAAGELAPPQTTGEDHETAGQ